MQLLFIIPDERNAIEHKHKSVFFPSKYDPSKRLFHLDLIHLSLFKTLMKITLTSNTLCGTDR